MAWFIKVVQKPIELKTVGPHACATMNKGTRFPTKEAAAALLSTYQNECATIHEWRIQRE